MPYLIEVCFRPRMQPWTQCDMRLTLPCQKCLRFIRRACCFRECRTRVQFQNRKSEASREDCARFGVLSHPYMAGSAPERMDDRLPSRILLLERDLQTVLDRAQSPICPVGCDFGLSVVPLTPQLFAYVAVSCGEETLAQPPPESFLPNPRRHRAACQQACSFACRRGTLHRLRPAP